MGSLFSTPKVSASTAAAEKAAEEARVEAEATAKAEEEEARVKLEEEEKARARGQRGFRGLLSYAGGYQGFAKETLGG